MTTNAHPGIPDRLDVARHLRRPPCVVHTTIRLHDDAGRGYDYCTVCDRITSRQRAVSGRAPAWVVFDEEGE